MRQINDPLVLAELAALHERYEAALVGNDVASLTGFFWNSPHALRFGVAESLYGAAEIEAFRQARSPLNLARDVYNLKIVALGGDTGIITLEFRRKVPGAPLGRQSQVWRKFPEGWKIVSAHVSLVPESYVDRAAALVGLPIPAEFREGVTRNLELAATIVSPLLGSPMDQRVELAPVFEPGV